MLGIAENHFQSEVDNRINSERHGQLWGIEFLALSRGVFGTRPLDHRDERLTTLVGAAHLVGKADAHRADAFGAS